MNRRAFLSAIGLSLAAIPVIATARDFPLAHREVRGRAVNKFLVGYQHHARTYGNLLPGGDAILDGHYHHQTNTKRLFRWDRRANHWIFVENAETYHDHVTWYVVDAPVYDEYRPLFSSQEPVNHACYVKNLTQDRIVKCRGDLNDPRYNRSTYPCHVRDYTTFCRERDPMYGRYGR